MYVSLDSIGLVDLNRTLLLFMDIEKSYDQEWKKHFRFSCNMCNGMMTLPLYKINVVFFLNKHQDLSALENFSFILKHVEPLWSLKLKLNKNLAICCKCKFCCDYEIVHACLVFVQCDV